MKKLSILHVLLLFPFILLAQENNFEKFFYENVGTGCNPFYDVSVWNVSHGSPSYDISSWCGYFVADNNGSEGLFNEYSFNCGKTYNIELDLQKPNTLGSCDLIIVAANNLQQTPAGASL